MKYCYHCGSAMEDDAMFCSNCGTSVANGNGAQQNAQPMYAQPYPQSYPQQTSQNSDMLSIANVFFILGTVLLSICTLCIALAWCLPMRSAINARIARRQPIGVALKVCTLLFVSVVADILYLCCTDEY